MVEQDAVAGEQFVGLAVVDGLPVRLDLCAGVGASRIERRVFGLRNLGDLAVHLAAGRLVESHFLALAVAVIANRFQEMERADRADLCRVHGLIEARAHVRLRAEVIDFVGFAIADDSPQVYGVEQIAVVKVEANVLFVSVLVEVVDTLGRKDARPAHDAMHFVPLVEQQLREIRPILSGDSGNQCDFRHG